MILLRNNLHHIIDSLAFCVNAVLKKQLHVREQSLSIGETGVEDNELGYEILSHSDYPR